MRLCDGHLGKSWVVRELGRPQRELGGWEVLTPQRELRGLQRELGGPYGSWDRTGRALGETGRRKIKGGVIGHYTVTLHSSAFQGTK